MIFEKQKYGLGILVDVDLDVSTLKENKKTILITKDKVIEINSKSGVLDKISIIIGFNCKVRIKENFKSGVRGQLLNLEVGENSIVDYEFYGGGRNFSLRNGFVKKNGVLNWRDKLEKGFNRIVTRTYLEGENSESDSIVICEGKGDDLFDINNEIIHLGDNSKSKIVNKAVLDDKSRQVYRGLIKIIGKNCDGNQKSDTILLSKSARADSIPNLEIENDEVICSHSVTISKIDEEILFYMMSRGLSLESAKKEYISGFLDEK